MKTDDLDLGQKVIILNFSYGKVKSQTANLFYMWKVVRKWKEEGGKKVENQDKKTSIFFCLGASTWRDEMPLIKVAYFMLNFLNLKSFLSNLFFAVASSDRKLWRSMISVVIGIFRRCFKEKIHAYSTWPERKSVKID